MRIRRCDKAAPCESTIHCCNDGIVVCCRAVRRIRDRGEAGVKPVLNAGPFVGSRGREGGMFQQVARKCIDIVAVRVGGEIASVRDFQNETLGSPRWRRGSLSVSVRPSTYSSKCGAYSGWGRSQS
jgi:hypothetical protein